MCAASATGADAARRAAPRLGLGAGILLLALALALGAAACGGRERPGLPPRLVLLVTVDALRPDRLSAYGYPRPTTALAIDDQAREEGRARSIDHLVEDGVSFAACFAPGPRPRDGLAALLGGRTARAAGNGSASGPTLAEALAAEGFATYAFVARAGGAALPPELARGFAHVVERPDDLGALGAAYAWVLEHDFGNDRPVLAWIHLAGLAPPWPGAAENELVPRFLPPGSEALDASSAELLERAARGELDPAELREVLAGLYDADLAATNRLLARFLDRYHFLTTTSGAWKRGVFVLAGTCGAALGEREQGYGVTDALGDATLRVPLVLRHPDSLTGARVLAEVVTLADVAPTLLEWFGAPVPPAMDGRSLLAVTDSFRHRPFDSRPALARGADGALSLRTERWRLVLPAPGADGGARLFDHALGARPERDVAAAHPDVAAELAALARAIATAP